MNYIDVILIAVMAVVVMISVKSGFFKTLFDLIAYVFAFSFAKSVSPLLAQSAFDSLIRKGAEAYLNSALAGIESSDYVTQAKESLESIPEGLRGLLQIIGFTQEDISQKLSDAGLTGENITNSVMDNIIEPVGVAIMQFVIFVILAIVLLIAARIVVRLLNGIVKKLPVIRKFNSILGGVLGFAKSIVFATVISGLISVIASVSDNQSFIDAVSGSALMNIFTDFIGNFTL